MTWTWAERGTTAITIVCLIVWVAVAGVKGCSDGPRAERVLKASGYTDITTGGYSLGCEDNQCTSFKAKGPNGQRVSGAVGCGWFAKNCTVRIDE
jgi:hypothetical protein